MSQPQIPVDSIILGRTFEDGSPNFTEFRVQVTSVDNLVLSRTPSLGDLLVFISEDRSFPNRAWYRTQVGWVEWRKVDIKITHPSCPSRCLTASSNGFKWINKTAMSASRKRLHKHLDELSAHKCIEWMVKTEVAKQTQEPQTKKKTLQKRLQRAKRKMEKLSGSECAEDNNNSRRKKRKSTHDQPQDDEKDESDSENSMMDVENLMNEIGVADDSTPNETNEEDSTPNGLDDDPDAAEPEAQNDSTRNQPNTTSNCRDRFVAGREGTEFPLGAKRLEWASHNVETYAPFVKHGILDTNIAEFMANAPTAESLGHVLVLQWPGPNCSEAGKEIYELAKKARAALSRGLAVVLKGWRPDCQYKFTVEDMRCLRPNMNQTVDWQATKLTRLNSKDATKRAAAYAAEGGDTVLIHSATTLEQFIRLADDPEVCGNALDLPNLKPEAPSILSMLADEIDATTATIGDNYAKSHKNPDRSNGGPTTFLFDAWKSTAWDIATHGGFVTLMHKDATGKCTYVYARSGAKMWGVCRPRLVVGQDESREDVYRRLDPLFDPERITESEGLGTILLEPGDVLFQPPGAFHVVYTPVKGMTSGGHFFCYDTLHLTEFARAYDISKKPDTDDPRHKISTNSEHPSASRKLYRMALAMPSLSKTRVFFRRPTLALMMMIKKWEKYTPIEDRKFIERLGSVRLETINEGKAALVICDTIRRNLGMEWSDVEKEVELFSEDPGEPLRESDFIKK
ncbi:hypothetical protein BD410DRAFT_810230 [Rickenella mellea]|uniref:JmjC domain-containing protein n=1 Tax=Rickenella mellea TaxID=50990 RepID=A0A4Y7PFJ5_9AGAM|nr:hypothetical protein BD410DRAFT_810230 [Rickenella mellea]